MKKTLLILSSACFALSAMAEVPQEIQPLESLTVGCPASMRKVPARLNSADDVIFAPEGVKKNVTLTGSGYYVFMNAFLTDYTDLDLPSHVVYGENNEVYIYNILPNSNLNTYTKGIISGDKVTIELPQTVYYNEEWSEKGYNLNLLTLFEYQQEDEEGNPVFDEEGNPVMLQTYVEDEGSSTLTFNIDENGVWTTTDLSDERILGLYWSTGAGWPGVGARALSIAPFDDEPIEVPEDIEVSENFWSFILNDYGWPLNFAQGYDEIYFQGMCSFFPDAWVKATVEYGDTEATVRIAQDQYIGTYDNYYYVYTKCAKYDVDTQEYSLMPDDYQYELTWDFEENTIKAKDPEIWFVFNVNPDRMYALTRVQDIFLKHQDSFEGVPANPTDLVFNDMYETAGYSNFTFTVPAISTDDDLLLTDNLYYVVYVDGEEMTFEADEYAIPETVTEVPWTLNEFHIFAYNGSSRLIDIFITGIESIGVQSIYYYDGVETRSDIVSINLESGVDKVGLDKEIAKVVYFDLAGREVVNPANGLYIQHTTYTDGTTVSTKKFVR